MRASKNRSMAGRVGGSRSLVTLAVVVAVGMVVPAQFASASHDDTVHKLPEGDIPPMDTSPPLITPTLNPVANAAGWNRSDVEVSWSVVDLESGITSSSGCEPTTLTQETAGTVLTCEARNGAGSSVVHKCDLSCVGALVSESVTIKIDKTDPAIDYGGNAGVYTVDQEVAITCAASDALSGLVSSTCADISGPAHGFAIGANTFSAGATDAAGNEGTGSVTFTVQATADSLATLVEQLASEGTSVQGMISSLATAAAAGAKGNEQAKQGALNAFRHKVEAQRGKTLTDAQADLLIQLSMGL